MIKFDILNRFSGVVQFTAEIDCTEGETKSIKLGLAAKWAVKTGASLSRADLYGAYLYGADLSGANLSRASLSRADLSRADLSGANLSRANLSRASLSGASLSGADLSGASLYGADLSRADLYGADLSGANLSGADLSRADLYGAYHISDRVIDGGLRSDGYRFLLTRTEPGAWRIKAGCRNFTVAEGLTHWTKTRPPGDALGDETRLIVPHMVALAKLRAWPTIEEEAA